MIRLCRDHGDELNDTKKSMIWCHNHSAILVNAALNFSDFKGGAYPRPRMVARVATTLQLFAAETCNKFLKIEHLDSIVYSKHGFILTFLAGATSDFTAGNTTQERLDLPARFLQQILLLPYFTMLQRVLLDFDFTFPFTNLF